MYILAVFSLALCIINIAMVANQTKEMQYCNQISFHYDGCGAGLLFPPNSFSRISFQMLLSSSLSMMNFTFMALFFSQCQILLKNACYNFPLHLLFFS